MSKKEIKYEEPNPILLDIPIAKPTAAPAFG